MNLKQKQIQGESPAPGQVPAKNLTGKKELNAGRLWVGTEVVFSSKAEKPESEVLSHYLNLKRLQRVKTTVT